MLVSGRVCCAFAVLTLAFLTSCSPSPPETGSERQQAKATSSDMKKADGGFDVASARGLPVTVAVWIAGASGSEVEKALLDRAKPGGAKSQMLLRSIDGSAFVEITAFQNISSRTEYQPIYVPRASAYWRRDFVWKDMFAQSKPLSEVNGKSHVQWSEFTLRKGEDIAPLYEIVNPMVATMIAGGAPTLTTADTLHATDNSSIGILATWSEAEGFGVFERQATFGEAPYWAPFADNAHWMLRPIQFR